MASYLRPTLLHDALLALAAGPRTILAGGTDHYPARATHEPDEAILDITGLADLGGLALGAKPPGAGTGIHGEWRIPALATWTDILRAPLPPLFDGLRQAARQVGGRQIQNTGTLAGNICNASPAADGIPALLALDAMVELRSLSGVRTLALGDFVLRPRRTARRPDELLTAILVPNRDAWSRFDKLGGRRYLVISISMVALTLAQDASGRVTHAAIAVGACGPVATRLAQLEMDLMGALPHPSLVEPRHLAPLQPIDDMRAPAAYRLDATLELLRRALAAPMEQAA